MLQVQDKGQSKDRSEGFAQLPDMSIVLEQLDDITQQRKRLLGCVLSDAATRDDLRLLREDIGR